MKGGERIRQIEHSLLVQTGDIRKLSDENRELKDTVQLLQAENTSLKAENQFLFLHGFEVPYSHTPIA